jgi:hypothetical protein
LSINRLRSLVRVGFGSCAAARPGRKGLSPLAEELELRYCPAPLLPALGVYRTDGNSIDYFISTNRSPTVDIVRSYGIAGDIPVVGDFNGNTVDNIGIFRPSNGQWSLDLDNNGTTDRLVGFGGPGWLPVVGDENGDGVSDLGIFSPSNGQWQFTDNFSGTPSTIFGFGGPGWTPLMADFNHDGRDDPVIYQNGTWEVDLNRDGSPDLTYHFGSPGDIPAIISIQGDRDPELAVFHVDPATNTAYWLIDFNRDGVNDTVYQLGIPGDHPITGNFSLANSIFVNPGGSDSNNGSEFSPLATVNQAIAIAPPGTFIRLSAGAFPQNIQDVERNGLSIVGAGIQATVIDPPSGDGALVVLANDVSFDNLWFRASGAGARALVAQGSTVDTLQIRTDGSQSGGLAADYMGQNAEIDTNYSQYNSVLTGEGLWLQPGTKATILNSTFNNDGTNPSQIPASPGGGGPAGGRGLRIEQNSTATVQNSQFIGNYGGGVVGLDGSNVSISHSTLSNNIKGNGAIFFGNSTVNILNDDFESNGQVRGATTGLNGLEFFFDYTGVATVDGNLFKNNTATGIFASGPHLTITHNTFDDNQIGIGLQGFSDAAPTVAVPTNATIQSNLFVVPTTRTDEVGMFGLGSAVTATIGGTGVENTFRNYASQHSIVRDRRPAGGVEDGPNFNVGANISDNSGTLESPVITVPGP